MVHDKKEKRVSVAVLIKVTGDEHDEPALFLNI